MSPLDAQGNMLCFASQLSISDGAGQRFAPMRSTAEWTSRFFAAMATFLGGKVRSVREHIGMNRSELAAHRDGHLALLRLENSEVADPTFAAVSRIARVLGVSLDWLSDSGTGSVDATLAAGALTAGKLSALRSIANAFRDSSSVKAKAAPDVPRRTPKEGVKTYAGRHAEEARAVARERPMGRRR